MLYCPGSGQELLSALGVTLLCHASNVFLVLKKPLLIIFSNYYNLQSVHFELTRFQKPNHCKQAIYHLQQHFPAPKFRPSMESQTNVVYKIPCTNCSWCCIKETGRAFNTYTRKRKHLRNTKTAAKGSRIANHAWPNNHAIDFENASKLSHLRPISNLAHAQAFLSSVTSNSLVAI